MMPVIDINRAIDLVSELNPEYATILPLVVKRNGEIRASKPHIDKADHRTGKAAYVWRMVVFQVSKKRAHQCMPICADFDLPAYDDNGKWSCSIARDMAKGLDPLADLIVNLVPKSEWHGLNRWGHALGYL
jgi:hypothetical protein